jgi:hypothetical protein
MRSSRKEAAIHSSGRVTGLRTCQPISNGTVTDGWATVRWATKRPELD